MTQIRKQIDSTSESSLNVILSMSVQDITAYSVMFSKDIEEYANRIRLTSDDLQNIQALLKLKAADTRIGDKFVLTEKIGMAVPRQGDIWKVTGISSDRIRLTHCPGDDTFMGDIYLTEWPNSKLKKYAKPI